MKNERSITVRTKGYDEEKFFIFTTYTKDVMAVSYRILLTVGKEDSNVFKPNIDIDFYPEDLGKLTIDGLPMPLVAAVQAKGCTEKVYVRMDADGYVYLFGQKPYYNAIIEEWTGTLNISSYLEESDPLFIGQLDEDQND